MQSKSEVESWRFIIPVNKSLANMRAIDHSKKDGGMCILPEFIAVWNRSEKQIKFFEEQTEDIKLFSC